MTHPMLDWINHCLDEDQKIAEAAAHGMTGVWEWQCNHLDFDGNLVHPLQPSHDLCAKLDCDEITLYDEGGHSPEQSRHIAHNDPASVLATVAAFRALLALHGPRPWCGDYTCAHCGELAMGEHAVDWPCDTVRALGTAFATRPGYDVAWAPT